mgnify:FL=1
MKFFKALSLIACFFLISQVNAQTGTSTTGTSAYADNAYVSNSISNIKSMLVKSGCKDALSDGQIVKLEKVFAAKEPRWNKVITSGLDKGDMAVEMAKLDAEYQDQIEKILSNEQKQAYRKMTSSRIKM